MENPGEDTVTRLLRDRRLGQALSSSTSVAMTLDLMVVTSASMVTRDPGVIWTLIRAHGQR